MQRVAVLGAGTMGHGIAQVCAASGATVRVTDVSEAALERGREGVRASLERMVAKGKLDAAGRDEVLGRIAWTASLPECVGDASLVVEAAHDFEELHHRHGVEEMQPHHPRRVAGHAGDLGDGLQHDQEGRVEGRRVLRVRQAS